MVIVELSGSNSAKFVQIAVFVKIEYHTGCKSLDKTCDVVYNSILYHNGFLHLIFCFDGEKKG
jgi:hypothetical protein